MSLSEIPPGHITVVSPSSSVARTHRLSELAAEALRSTDGSYSLHFCVPDALIETFSDRLLKKAGRRHYSRYSPASVFDTFQSLQHPRHILTRPARQRLVDELSSISSPFPSSSLSVSQLDDLVADKPDDSLCKAYTAGLESLGYRHPYLNLGHMSLAPSVTTVFVAEFDTLPVSIRRWFLDHIPRSIDIVASVSVEIDPALSQRQLIELLRSPDIRPTDSDGCAEHLRQFSDIASVMDELLSQVDSGSVDAVLCESISTQRAVEIRCLLDDISVRVEPVQSALYSLEFLSLVAYMDWVIDESEEPLHLLLEKLGSSSAKWKKFSRQNKLSSRLSVGCYLSSSVSLDEVPILSHLSHLSELLTKSRASDSLPDHLSAFADWASKYLIDFDRSILDLLHSEILSSSPGLTIPELRDRFYSAISRRHVDGPLVAIHSVVDSLRFPRVWALLDDGSTFSQSREFVDSVRPLTTADLYISSTTGA